MKTMEIDGSHLEAGGQILRTALSLSAITHKPFHMFNIRSGRAVPGLQPQHIKCIEASASLCDAAVSSIEKGCQELEFTPHKIQSGMYEFDIGTAGSVALVLQALLPICINAKEPVRIVVHGGTDVKWSPPIKYFQHIFCYYMKKINIDLTVNVKRHGFYPKGGGEVLLEVNPSALQEIDMQHRGMLQRIDVHSTASATLEKANVAGRQLQGFLKNISKLYLPLVKNKFLEYVPSSCSGSFVHCHAHYENAKIGASALGEPGLKAETVGMMAAQKLIEEMKTHSPFDEYMQDQIILYMALSSMANKKPSIIRTARMTNHTETNMWAVEQFLPVKFHAGKDVLECNLV